MSVLALTMSVQMERQNSDVFIQNGHGYTPRRRNAMGDIFQNVDHEVLYSKLLQELKMNGCESESVSQENNPTNDGCDNTGNKFG